MRRSSYTGAYMSLVSVIRANYVTRANASIRQTDERYTLMRSGAASLHGPSELEARLKLPHTRLHCFSEGSGIMKRLAVVLLLTLPALVAAAPGGWSSARGPRRYVAATQDLTQSNHLPRYLPAIVPALDKWVRTSLRSRWSIACCCHDQRSQEAYHC